MAKERKKEKPQKTEEGIERRHAQDRKKYLIIICKDIVKSKTKKILYLNVQDDKETRLKIKLCVAKQWYRQLLTECINRLGTSIRNLVSKLLKPPLELFDQKPKFRAWKMTGHRKERPLHLAQ